MKLFIDTSNSEKIRLILGGEEFVADAREKKAQMLLPFIVFTLKKKSLGFSDITEIEVVTSGASFTGIRVGVSVAQTLGYLLGIKVNGKQLPEESLDISY